MTPDLLIAATGCAPAGADHLAECLTAAMDRFSIDTPMRQAHFLAQCAHESGLFMHVEESLNYSPEGLVATWPTRFYMPPAASNGRANALQYGRTAQHPADQMGIASLVYSGRMGNGAAASGDGARFIGRGFIALTGRDNYTAFHRAVPECPCLDLPVSLTATVYAALSAAWFWSVHGCNDAADANDVTRVTRIVNGGLNGLQQRTALTIRALDAFASAPP